MLNFDNKLCSFILLTLSLKIEDNVFYKQTSKFLIVLTQAITGHCWPGSDIVWMT